MLLRHYLEQGLSKAEIARRLQVSRRTLHHWIATGQLDRTQDEVRYGPRPRIACKLDEYRAVIDERLAAYPRLSATRLYDEVRAAGYLGGYTQLKEHVRRVRPRPPGDPVVRYETKPGVQAQVDFAEFKLPWGKRFALVVVLGYSRLLWMKFYPRQTMEVLMAGLAEAFAAIGGVPLELLFDQMKAVIVDDQRESGGSLLENAQFHRFAAHYGFRIRACRPYRARTKGKVERPISYVRQGFFYGRSFVGDDDLDAQLHAWLAQKANRRRHRTVNEVPVERFIRDERALLQALPAHPYQPPAARPTPAAAKPAATQPARARRAGNTVDALPKVEQRPLREYAQAAGGQA